MIAERYVLFTNLQFVTIGSIRTFTHALLLEEYENPFERGALKHRMRGFGTDPAWPVFDLHDLASIEYALVPAESQHVVVGDAGEMRPLATGYIMKIGRGPTTPAWRVELHVSDPHRPLDVATFDTARHGKQSIVAVWDALPGKVARYWGRPNMPMLNWGPAPIGARR